MTRGRRFTWTRSNLNIRTTTIELINTVFVVKGSKKNERFRRHFKPYLSLSIKEAYSGLKVVNKFLSLVKGIAFKNGRLKYSWVSQIAARKNIEQTSWRSIRRNQPGRLPRRLEVCFKLTFRRVYVQ